MDVRTDEIAEQIYRVSVFVPQAAEGFGFTFNHFLIVGDEPLLFHCGLKKMFPLVSTAVGKIMPIHRLRWLSFGHFEADECGSMNEWLAAAPYAEIMHGMVGCRVSIADMADRPPRSLTNGDTVDIGGKRVRYIDTPHVPHGWDAGVIYEETTRTLLCGDLFTRLGNGPPLTESDIVEPAMTAEDFFSLTSLGPTTAPNIRNLAEPKPKTLAIMAIRVQHAIAKTQIDQPLAGLSNALPHHFGNGKIFIGGTKLRRFGRARLCERHIRDEPKRAPALPERKVTVCQTTRSIGIAHAESVRLRGLSRLSVDLGLTSAFGPKS